MSDHLPECNAAWDHEFTPTEPCGICASMTRFEIRIREDEQKNNKCSEERVVIGGECYRTGYADGEVYAIHKALKDLATMQKAVSESSDWNSGATDAIKTVQNIIFGDE